MIFYRVTKYLKYILLSRHRNGQGIHSPFVFDLVNRVFRNKIDTDIVFNIEKVRQSLLSDYRSIIVNDLGSGADMLKTNLRKVSDITRYSPVPQKYGVLLSKLAAEFGSPLIVELGTSFGISTMYMSASCPDALVYTVEGCPSTVEIAKQNFNETGLKNIKIFTGSFDENFPDISHSGNKPGLVFIDGNHRKESVISYFNRMVEMSDSETVMVIDDIYYSREMEEAWDEIKQDEKVSFTVDIFRMGIVFFRQGVSYKNYIIRY